MGRIPLVYPNREGLAVFVVGPTQLAFMAGRAINPNVFSSAWFPQFHDNRYWVGSKYPWVDQVRIAYCLAAPSGFSPLDIHGEERQIIKTMDRPAAQGRLHLHGELGATFDDFFDILMREKPNILHFGGHANESNIVLERKDGTTDEIPIEALQDTLASARDKQTPLHLFVLNGCRTAEQAEALTAQVKFAIGTTHPVNDRRAIDFSRRFYGALAEGRTLQNAFDQARAYLRKYGEDVAENFKLFSQPGCNPSQFRFVQPLPPEG